MEEKLMKALCDALHYEFDEEACVSTLDIKKTVANLIANGVTVPVRCKQCKYGKQTAWYSSKLRCAHPSHMNSQVPYEVSPDHFCSDGKR